MSTPRLSILIVSWNVSELLKECLHSIEAVRETVPLEVIVVDSGSSDDTVAMVRASYPWVQLLPQPENVGFARGNNIAIEEARGETLFLLNPDTVVVGNALQTLLDTLERHPEAGVVGPQLRFPDGSPQSSRRRFPTLTSAFFESTWLEPWAPRHVIERYHATDLPPHREVEVDWIVGAAMMVRRAVVETVGLLDEEYFMYSEELDWCRRIRAAGWRILHQPAAVVVHHAGKSSEQAATDRHINFQRAKLRYFRKHHGNTAYGALRLFLLLNYLWQLLLECGKWLLGHRRALRRQRVVAYWQVLRSGLPAAGASEVVLLEAGAERK
ncbi:MAG: glycosyltransferase family 2 protein [Candidatus Promineifilaceae bacterium]|nr:glycosyltransferase family 2 protein [Candidatus Promineifilaceae bacterium]